MASNTATSGNRKPRKNPEDSMIDTRETLKKRGKSSYNTRMYEEEDKDDYEEEKKEAPPARSSIGGGLSANTKIVIAKSAKSKQAPHEFVGANVMSKEVK